MKGENLSAACSAPNKGQENGSPSCLANARVNAHVKGMSNCALCDTPISSLNDSAEHLIHNAIGGFRKIKGFICKPCNNSTGHDWDAELAGQLNGLCHFFAIERDRGSIPSEAINTTAGETFKMLPDGGFALMRPTVEKIEDGAQTQYRVVARNMREAHQILTGLKRKALNLDIEAELAKAHVQTSYLQGLVELPIQIGGIAAGRAIVKSAVVFAHGSKIPAAACDQALSYLRDKDATPCFGYYQSTDVMISRPPGVPLHCIAISGDPVTGLLLGYVEYFGFLRVVILLSETFLGPKIDRCYAIDPTLGKELDLSVRLEFTLADIRGYLRLQALRP
jgi:HNH endonuclease